jgi:nicotinamide mononucleotide transporter
VDAPRGKISQIELWVLALLSAALVAASYAHWAPYSLLESLGVATGGVCVYLVVRENVWNFPTGIASSVFFLIVFLQARLYNDAGLQVFFIVLGFQGWYLWLFGGEHRTELKVGRSSPALLLGLLFVVAGATVGLRYLTAWATHQLGIAPSSAPWLDALTTALSLGGQYLLNRKLIENWWFWIVADTIYIPLYFSRDLHLTAALYAIFLGLCVAGIRSWNRAIQEQRTLEQAEIEGAQAQGITAAAIADEKPHA